MAIHPLIRIFPGLLVVAVGWFARGADVAPAVPQRFIIGLSPYLDRAVKDEVYRDLVRLLVQDLPLNSTATFYDAARLRTIAQVTLPDARAFASPKTRANQFAPAIHDLKLFLAAEAPKPAGSPFDFTAAVRLPQFCDFLAENAGPAATRVLLFGSPLYLDDKEPAFSMSGGYFPSDGHLPASREQSIFGAGTDARPVPMTFYWAYFGDPWVSDLHKEKVSRFWTLYLEKRGGRLAVFASDLATALQGFRDGTAPPPNRWTVDPQQTKIEMLRVTRDVEVADWLTRDTLAEPAPRPPATTTGPMKIGIRWADAIDLDLYACARRGAETLYFQHPRAPEGYYYKDHRSSPGREYEFIEFEAPVDVREVEAFVNFYEGACPGGPRGEVRIEFAGRIYSAAFSLRAPMGNHGRAGQGQEAFWTRIPVPAILRLASGAAQ